MRWYLNEFRFFLETRFGGQLICLVTVVGFCEAKASVASHKVTCSVTEHRQHQNNAGLTLPRLC